MLFNLLVKMNGDGGEQKSPLARSFLPTSLMRIALWTER